MKYGVPAAKAEMSAMLLVCFPGVGWRNNEFGKFNWVIVCHRTHRNKFQCYRSNLLNKSDTIIIACLINFSGLIRPTW